MGPIRRRRSPPLRTPQYERKFVRRASTITIRARLYLGGAYLRLLSEQAILQGSRLDPDLAAVIVRLT